MLVHEEEELAPDVAEEILFQRRHDVLDAYARGRGAGRRQGTPVPPTEGQMEEAQVTGRQLTGRAERVRATRWPSERTLLIRVIGSSSKGKPVAFLGRRMKLVEGEASSSCVSVAVQHQVGRVQPNGSLISVKASTTKAHYYF